MSEEKLRKLVDNRVPGLFAILVIFAGLEFGILVICMAFSGNQDIVKIYNPQNELIYENAYNLNHIKEFKTVTGITDFKDSGFVLTRLKKQNSFPTRAWIALSICIPLILILFTAFVIKVFEDMFNSKKDNSEKQKKSASQSDFEETRFEKLFSTLGRLNIYSLGTTVLAAAFLYWMVPDLLVYVGKISIQTISELKWVILGIALAGSLYLIIKAILSYKTRKEIIRHQTEIQKNRDRLAIEAKRETILLDEKNSSPRTGTPPGE